MKLMNNIYQKILEVINSNKKAALCTIVLTKGSTPLKSGAKMLVFEDGSIYNTIGGGHLEKITITDAIEVIKSEQPKLFIHELKSQHEMCCGGSLEIFIEPIMQKKKMFLFGAGHVGKAIVKHALGLDLEISVIDSRDEIFNDWDFSGYKKIVAPFTQILPTLPYDNLTMLVIATYDHSIDREILAFCMKQPHYYIGMIGSKTKVALTKEMFVSENIATAKELEKVDMPIGIDINAVTADEIAISIVAKLIKEKNKK